MHRQLIDKQRSTTKICLGRKNLTSEDVLVLVREGQTSHIEYLDLNSNRLSFKDVECLTTGLWSKLTVLHLYSSNDSKSIARSGCNEIGDLGCRIMTKIELPSIKTISMGKQVLTQRITELAEWGSCTFQNLPFRPSAGSYQVLLIKSGTNPILQLGMLWLIRLPNQMEKLKLNECRLGYFELQRLAMSEWSIENTLLYDNAISESQASQLKAIIKDKHNKCSNVI